MVNLSRAINVEQVHFPGSGPKKNGGVSSKFQFGVENPVLVIHYLDQSRG